MFIRRIQTPIKTELFSIILYNRLLTGAALQRKKLAKAAEKLGLSRGF